MITPLSDNEKIKIDFYLKAVENIMLKTDPQWNFFQSLKSQWSTKKRLTEKQRSALYKMYERVTS